MALGDAPDNSQTQATAWNLVVRTPIEPVEDPLPILRRNARPGIGHGKDRYGLGMAYRHVHRATHRGITNGIIDQIAQQYPQILSFARYYYRFARCQSQIDTAGIGQRSVFRDGIPASSSRSTGSSGMVATSASSRAIARS